MQDSFITSYVSRYGGALAFLSPDTTRQNFDRKYLGLELLNNRFENNIATEQGGALYIENPVYGKIKDCQFSNNMANSKLAE